MSLSPPNMLDREASNSIESQTSSDCYIQDCVIGNGAYGTVYMAINIHNQSIVAMKKVRVPVRNGLPSSTLREISMLKFINRLEHPNIIRLLDVCHGEQTPSGQLSLYLIFEHLEQDLATYLSRMHPLKEPAIKELTHQIVCGIDFLHCNRVFHRDLKPQNLLISKKGIVKLADFGLAKTYNCEMKLTSVVVTLWYRSPEVLLGDRYDSSLDVWSIGCIMAEMYLGKPLFQGSSEGDQLDKIFRIMGSPLECEWPSEVVTWSSFAGRQPVCLKSLLPGLSDVGNDLLKKLLCFNTHQRISARETMGHQYFSDSGYQVPILNLS